MPQGGTATPIAPGMIARARDGLRYIISGVTPSTWFGPFQPLQPQAPPEVAGRQFDYPVGYNLETRPRADEPISFHQLRALADSCDLVRTVIETRKDQVERLDWTIRHRDRPDGEPAARRPDPRIAAIEEFFRMPDRANFWSGWLRQLLEDLFVIDAPALYLRRTRASRLFALEPIDGATVKRLLNADGRTPSPPDPAYQQILHGLPAADLTTRDLIYRPRNLRAHRIYGYSPVEQIVMTVNIALRRQMFQLSYYTEGNVPEALIGTPESWGPNQIKEFQQYWDALLEGNLAQRRHAKFVPGGVAKTFIPTKDAELKNDYDEWLARIICFAFSISPQPFVERMNRATAETAHNTALSEGLAPIQNWIKQLVDFIIVTEFEAPDLEFRWRDDGDSDPATAASVAQTYVTNGIKSVNEVRAEIGLDPVAGGDAPMIVTATGPVALARLGGAPAQGKASGLDRPPLRKDFNPDQPRVAAGNPDGRQWAAAGSGSSDGDGENPAATATGGRPVQVAQADTGAQGDADPVSTTGNNRIVARTFDVAQWDQTGQVDSDRPSLTVVGGNRIAIETWSSAGPLPTNQFWFTVEAQPLNSDGTPQASLAAPQWFQPVWYSSGPTGGIGAQQFVLEASSSAPMWNWIITLPPQEDAHGNYDFDTVTVYRPKYVD